MLFSDYFNFLLLRIVLTVRDPRVGGAGQLFFYFNMVMYKVLFVDDFIIVGRKCRDLSIKLARKGQQTYVWLILSFN